MRFILLLLLLVGCSEVDQSNYSSKVKEYTQYQSSVEVKWNQFQLNYLNEHDLLLKDFQKEYLSEASGTSESIFTDGDQEFITSVPIKIQWRNFKKYLDNHEVSYMIISYMDIRSQDDLSSQVYKFITTGGVYYGRIISYWEGYRIKDIQTQNEVTIYESNLIAKIELPHKSTSYSFKDDLLASDIFTRQFKFEQLCKNYFSKGTFE